MEIAPRTRLAIAALVTALAVTGAAPPISGGGTADEAKQMRVMVSGTREAHGLRAIGSHPALKQLARRQAVRMRDRGKIFHTEHLVDDLNAITTDWTVVGENVGAGPRVIDIEKAFMASKPHKRNITSSRYNALGIAVAVSDTGRRYVAQVFARIGGMGLAEDGSYVYTG